MHVLLGLLFALSQSLTPHITSLHHAEQVSCQLPNSQVERMPVLQRIAQNVDFGVSNVTTVNVGWLNIHLADNSYSYIDITGQGTFSTSLTSQAYECAIHGQSFAPNTPTRIIIDTHTSVRVTWTGNIIVIDDVEIN